MNNSRARFVLWSITLGSLFLIVSLWLTGTFDHPFSLSQNGTVGNGDGSKSHPSESQGTNGVSPASKRKKVVFQLERRFPKKNTLDSSSSLTQPPIAMWSFEQAKGKKTFLHFWATWCPPCIEEIGKLRELAKSYEAMNEEFLFVFVSLDQSWEDAEKVLSSDDLPKNVVSTLDPEKKVAEELGSYHYPETYLIDEKGQMITKLVGPQDWSDDEIVESIRSVFSHANDF